MPILGLVVRLPADPGIADRVRGALARDPRVTPAEPEALRLPIVLETRGAREEIGFIDSLLQTGALAVEVAFASFEDLLPWSEPDSTGEETQVGPAT